MLGNNINCMSKCQSHMQISHCTIIIYTKDCMKWLDVIVDCVIVTCQWSGKLSKVVYVAPILSYL